MVEPQNPERLLEVENLDVGYGATRVVWDVSLEVHRRQVVSLIGPNGAGKTTLLKALAGLLPVRKGKIIFDGKDISSEPAHERVQHHLALVPEGRQLWSRMTVEENLLMGGFSPQLRSKAHSNLERIYELFPRLKERRKQLAGTLSGGEQQMCAIGRALMAAPKLLMLADPSLGLAPIIVADIFRTIGELRASGVSVLLVEQNAQAALQIADRAYVMELGEFVLQGTAKDIAGNARVAASYLGL